MNFRTYGYPEKVVEIGIQKALEFLKFLSQGSGAWTRTGFFDELQKMQTLGINSKHYSCLHFWMANVYVR